MKDILRYVKVTAIKDKTVLMAGVNPPTGKHVPLEFETIEDSTVLRSLRYALTSRIFIKVLAGEKAGESDFEFQEEKPAKDREDSYFTIFSYCSKAGYNPLFLRRLDHHLVIMDYFTNPCKELGKSILNMTDKLGNVFYAKKQIEALNVEDRAFFPEIRYHVMNAIVSSKACTEGLAVILNEVYGIGYSKGNIDLATNRSDLLHKIAQINPKLGAGLKKYESWINRIADYRDFVIHKMMLLTPPQPVKTLGTIELIRCTVPSSPLTIGDSAGKGMRWVEAEEYCKNLTKHLEGLIEIVCVDLLQLIESGTYYPI